MTFQRGDALASRAAGRDNVLDYENTFGLTKRKSTSQRHLAILPLGPDKSNAEGLCHRKSYDQTPDSRRSDGVDLISTKLLRYRCPKPSGVRRLLQSERALQILRTVQPAREHKVPVEQCIGPSKMVEYLGLFHDCLRVGL